MAPDSFCQLFIFESSERLNYSALWAAFTFAVRQFSLFSAVLLNHFRDFDV